MTTEDAEPVRAAFISDIHGNFPAFQAVLAELDRRGPFEYVVGGGDFAFGGIYPAECLALVRERQFECVRGNTDEWIVELATDGRVPAQGYRPEDRHSGAVADNDRWQVAHLDSAAIQFLADLPLDWRVVGPSGRRLGFVHATPWSAHENVMPDAPDEVADRMLDAAEVDTLVYGHIHIAYQRDVGSRALACAGAVGLPLDGIPRPSFLIASDEGDGWRLEHVRVEYDREAYAEQLLASDMPNAAVFAGRVRAAR